MCQLVSEKVLHWKRIFSRKISFEHRSGSYPDSVRVEYFFVSLLKVVASRRCTHMFACMIPEGDDTSVCVCARESDFPFVRCVKFVPFVECRSKCLCMSSRRIWQHTQYNKRGAQSEKARTDWIFPYSHKTFHRFGYTLHGTLYVWQLDGWIYIQIALAIRVNSPVFVRHPCGGCACVLYIVGHRNSLLSIFLFVFATFQLDFTIQSREPSSNIRPSVQCHSVGPFLQKKIRIQFKFRLNSMWKHTKSPFINTFSPNLIEWVPKS